MAKLTRERRLMERRLDKQARKLARKQGAADASVGEGDATTTDDQAPEDRVDGEAPEEVARRIA